MDGGSGPARLRFAVLGPVRAWRGEEPLPTGSPLQRALLAVLLLRGGRIATAAELVDALWGDEPPHAALAALRTYASRLRKSLGDAADILVSESGGYALRLGSTAVFDLDLVEEHAAAAEKALGEGDRGRARDLLEAALAVWEGETLAGLPGPHAATERTRLEERRLRLAESRLELELELGGHAQAVSELTALTAAHPLCERLRELLMLALYRSGRQAEALAVYADTRRLLAEELGVDPRPELAALQQRILCADADLAHPAAPPEGRAATGTVTVQPAQLPATVADFTGRAASVGELSDRLATAEGRVMAVSAVAGIGGVGKTTLAVHVAHAARERFPDGQLYVDLEGAGPAPAEPQAVLGAFLRALGTADAAIPEGVEERAALYRSTLAGRRMLVLLDNARDAAQVRPLLPGNAGCAALVTSRNRMVDLAGAHLVDLDVMSPEEALALFTRVVGAERVGAERDAAMDVVAACGFLPLAIRIAASRLAARRTWTVSVLARKLGDGRHRLDELRAGDLAVKATFELGYGQLEPRQARAFRLLGLADGPDVSLAAAAAVLGLAAEDAEDLLESLVDASLLESAAPGRYRYHDLVRLYARSCAERDEAAAEREAALSRLLDFYLATAARVYALERPGDRSVDHLEPTRHPGLAPADRKEALDWLYTEADCLLACVEQSTARGMLRRAVALLMAAVDLAESGADGLRYERAAAAVCRAAREAGDARAQGRALAVRTHVHNLTGRFDQADRAGEEAGLFARAAGDPVAAAWALNDRGITAIYQQRHEDAQTHLRQAIEAFRAYDDRPGEASALCNLSRVQLALGRTADAVELAQRGVRIYRGMGLTLRLANGRYALGLVLTQAGRLAEASEELSGALALFRGSRQRLWEGMALFRLAELHLAADEPAQAAAHAEQALAVLRGIGGQWRRGNVLTVLGRALDGVGHADRARVCWREALAAYEQSGSPEADEVRRLLAPAAV